MSRALSGRRHSHNQQNRRILLVGRDATKGNRYAAILGNHGYTVQLVGTAEEALHCWSRNRPELVLILCNANGAYDDGVTWCGAVLCKFPDLRVVFLNHDCLFLAPPLFESANGNQASPRRADFLEKLAAILASR